MRKKQKPILQDRTRNGECTACGECCGTLLPLTQTEVRRIHLYIKKHHIRPTGNIALFMRKPSIFGDCPFLDRSREKKCLIYETRPLICRDFRCDKTSSDMSDDLTTEKRYLVNMRETFGGGE